MLQCFSLWVCVSVCYFLQSLYRDILVRYQKDTHDVTHIDVVGIMLGKQSKKR